MNYRFATYDLPTPPILQIWKKKVDHKNSPRKSAKAKHMRQKGVDPICYLWSTYPLEIAERAFPPPPPKKNVFFVYDIPAFDPPKTR